MRVTGWNNGSHRADGSGYGLRISKADRDRFFDRDRHSLILELGNDESVVVSVAPSFWAGCTELRSARIGRWLIGQGLAPWPAGQPPVLVMEQVEAGRFAVRILGVA
ncbi:hypothetical protein [Nonomuraea sp. NPDC050643]|uniref:hypothetical protein n=1 Tax=Nonomuraea sp. NPDC050643 TaxID=3155660 RepID=UPI0033E60308